MTNCWPRGIMPPREPGGREFSGAREGVSRACFCHPNSAGNTLPISGPERARRQENGQIQSEKLWPLNPISGIHIFSTSGVCKSPVLGPAIPCSRQCNGPAQRTLSTGSTFHCLGEPKRTNHRKRRFVRFLFLCNSLNLRTLILIFQIFAKLAMI